MAKRNGECQPASSCSPTRLLGNKVDDPQAQRAVHRPKWSLGSKAMAEFWERERKDVQWRKPRSHEGTRERPRSPIFSNWSKQRRAMTKQQANPECGGAHNKLRWSKNDGWKLFRDDQRVQIVSTMTRGETLGQNGGITYQRNVSGHSTTLKEGSQCSQSTLWPSQLG